MTTQDMMTKEETKQLVAVLLTSVLRSEQFDEKLISQKKYIDPIYIEEILDWASQLIYERLQELPKKVSDDFETREIIQQKVDELTSGIVLQIRQALEKLKKP